MTLHDFNRAKEIQEELHTINSNIDALNHTWSYSACHPNATHRFKTQSYVSTEFVCDKKFLELAIEYYENEEKKLNAEFEALGKEKQL
jgi:hypothetical protein